MSLVPGGFAAGPLGCFGGEYPGGLSTYLKMPLFSSAILRSVSAPLSEKKLKRAGDESVNIGG